MARVRMVAVVPHSTHDPMGAQLAHAVDDVYEVDDIDVDNLITLGFARRAADREPPPPTPQAPSQPVTPMTTATMPTSKPKATRK